jgi:hypothetical protein
MTYNESIKQLQQEADHGWYGSPDDKEKMYYEIGFYRSRAAVLAVEVVRLRTEPIKEMWAMNDSMAIDKFTKENETMKLIFDMIFDFAFIGIAAATLFGIAVIIFKVFL